MAKSRPSEDAKPVTLPMAPWDYPRFKTRRKRRMTMLHITEERLLEMVDMKADELFAAIDEIKADPIQKSWVYDAEEAALNRMLAEARAEGMREALEDVHEADSLELAQHGQSKIVERIRARAAAIKEG
jgi:hypothetical protein